MNHLPFMPTPLMALPYYSKSLDVKLLCKRDDLFIQAGGGSKARMLQYILADVSSENCDVLLTAGGPCSNFNRACALMCAKIGIPMHLIEYTDELKEFDTSMNYFICKLSGIQTTRCNKSDVPQTINEIIRKYSEESKKVKYVYGGGKSVEGIYAYYDAIKELYDANAEIDHLFVACGTGTTLTGICAGMQRFYPDATVHAISTARTYEAEIRVLLENMRLFNGYLGTEYSFENMEFTDKFLCGGYAKYKDDIINTIKECISKEGMIIDPTYSGKAFWGMKHIILSDMKFKDKNILFWNTGGLYNLLSIK